MMIQLMMMLPVGLKICLSHEIDNRLLCVYPMNFELRQGGQGVRPMSVDILRDSANTRRQQSRNLKGEGYTLGKPTV
ncbi:hypothetical protein RINTU1_15470 [Candidatus Regiella insecticola]|uniref:Uncharacterized protein n=1 Tax=Candidatus Regiella insecticola TaxID=138073 RepID=A0A6L2ZML7_9ENTR|nr:hypothetical protein RINTU1_15470 [Candidatus Regiella insecticola]